MKIIHRKVSKLTPTEKEDINQLFAGNSINEAGIKTVYLRKISSKKYECKITFLLSNKKKIVATADREFSAAMRAKNKIFDESLKTRSKLKAHT